MPEKKTTMVFMLMIFVALAGCANEQDPGLPSSSPSDPPSNQNHNNPGGGDSPSDHNQAASPPTKNKVSLTPAELIVQLNDTFTVNVLCEPIQPIKGWEMTLNYDPLLLKAVSVDQGNFFDGFETFPSWNTIVDNVNGTITRLYNLILGKGTTNNTGTLATIEFKPLCRGHTPIRLAMVGLCNETMYVPVTATNNTIYITA